MECKWSQEHISIDQYGKFRPCCNWQNHTNEDAPLDFQNNSLQEYLNSDFKRNINQRLADNKWPGGCFKCKITEENNTQSIRTERKYLIKDMEIKFGNLCNLGCYMCTVDKSSVLLNTYTDMINANLGDDRIEQELKDHNYKQSFVNTPWYESKDKIIELAQFASTRSKLRFTGGEPTVNTYLRDFLQELVKHNTYITLRITTNAMNVTSKLLELLEQFMKVEITLSIDGTSEYNEYLRYPSNWNKINNNVQKFKSLTNTELDVNTVVSFLNVHLLEDIIVWGNDVGASRHMFLPAHEPDILNPSLSYGWQKKVFNNIFERYNSKKIRLDRCNKFVNKEQDINVLHDTFDYLDRLDNIRNTNWRNLFFKGAVNE